MQHLSSAVGYFFPIGNPHFLQNVQCTTLLAVSSHILSVTLLVNFVHPLTIRWTTSGAWPHRLHSGLRFLLSHLSLHPMDPTTHPYVVIMKFSISLYSLLTTSHLPLSFWEIFNIFFVQLIFFFGCSFCSMTNKLSSLAESLSFNFWPSLGLNLLTYRFLS